MFVWIRYGWSREVRRSGRRVYYDGVAKQKRCGHVVHLRIRWRQAAEALVIVVRDPYRCVCDLRLGGGADEARVWRNDDEYETGMLLC